MKTRSTTSRLIQRRATSFFEFGLPSPPWMAYTFGNNQVVKLPYTFRKVSRPLIEADIQEFEAKLGIRLPAGYRSFLREVNGGYPQNEGFSYGNGRSFMLQRLYPLTNELEPYFNLRSLNHPDNDAPTGFLVIGTSSFGDPVCLGVAPPNENKVIYLDHEERDPDEVDEDPMLGVYLLSDSFEEFMLSLEDEWAKLKEAEQDAT